MNGIESLDWITRKHNDVHFDPRIFGFDLKLTPHAFSEKLFNDEANFIVGSINNIMVNNPQNKFTIVGHSIGCLTAMLIENKINKHR